MKAAVLHRSGTVPFFERFREPPCSSSSGTLVNVVAAAIKPGDRAYVSGQNQAARHLPLIPGSDGIASIGHGHAYFVAERSPFGAMAERSTASWTVPLPPGLVPEDAAALVTPALEIWLPLAWSARLRPGEAVLFLGATKATARTAVQVARALGAGRIIVAGKYDATTSCGACLCFEYSCDEQQALTTLLGSVFDEISVVVELGCGSGAALQSTLSAVVGLAGRSPTKIRSVKVEQALVADAFPTSSKSHRPLPKAGAAAGTPAPVARLKASVAEILHHARAGLITAETISVPLSDVGEAWTMHAGDRHLVLRP